MSAKASAPASRWTQWIARESANPRLSMPWALQSRVRHGRATPPNPQPI
jgi:hypothetical protein